MHILITANSAWNIWNFRRPVVEALIADGHQVTVLAPSDGSVSNLEYLGCRFVPLEMDVKGLNPYQDLKLKRNFKRLFQSEKPNVILSYTIKNNIFGAMAANNLGIAFFPNVTGLGTAFLSGGLLQAVAERLYRRAFRPLKCVFFQNTDDRDLFLKRRLVQVEQTRLLPGSGIDLVHYTAADYPPQTQAPVFLMISRLLRDKGVMEFVEAARLVRISHPGVRFQLLGPVDAANRSAIDETSLKSWVHEGVIEYLGTAEDVRPHIANAHCVVLPSYREGAPRTLIEAAAMARPLIATDVPGCRSLVDNGTSGLLCTTKDGPDLAATCVNFLKLPRHEKIKMGLEGRMKMETEFDQAHVVRAYRDAVTSVPFAVKPPNLPLNLWDGK